MQTVVKITAALKIHIFTDILKKKKKTTKKKKTKNIGLIKDNIFIFYKAVFQFYLSRIMIKPTFCKCENKDADQLRGNREADLRHCFRYKDRTCTLLSVNQKFPPSSHLLSVQVGLCQTCSETTLLAFPRGGSYSSYIISTRV